ncbi:MAG: type IV pilus twitching motility protein PilT [Candidatus Gracilibacteria bacterium]|nr:type IV pilus twitching motility protein PilT [Candidatus Gracilibacteria bacterium]
MQIQDILKVALEKNASDIIITGGTKPSLKVNGDIYFFDDLEIISKEESKQIVLSIMNESQKIKFLHDLELDFSIELKGYSRFRVNAFVQKDGYSLVFRPIKTEIPEFDSLKLPEVIKKFTTKKNGLVLITGSVGSGKTTTLASLIGEINNNQSKHIITVEDPIEFVYKNKKSIIEQREVGTHTLTYDNGLKYALRQAPDVILIGEMRDLETFRLALRAAETGNLVFATLHTSGAARTVSRIIDMFPGDEKDKIRQQLSESLLGVVWQQLLKTSDGKGRVVASEVLVNSSSVANMIRKDQTHQIPNAIETGKENGMITMKSSIENLFGKGLIDEESYNYNLSLLDKFN